MGPHRAPEPRLGPGHVVHRSASPSRVGRGPCLLTTVRRHPVATLWISPFFSRSGPQTRWTEAGPWAGADVPSVPAPRPAVPEAVKETGRRAVPTLSADDGRATRGLAPAMRHKTPDTVIPRGAQPGCPGPTPPPSPGPVPPSGPPWRSPCSASPSSVAYGGGSDRRTSPPPPTSAPSSADAEGFALYTFPSDHNGMSTCTGACVSVWPALTVPAGTTPTAGTGVTGTVASVLQANGTYQVTYNGSPLYTFVGRHAAGRGHGEQRGRVPRRQGHGARHRHQRRRRPPPRRSTSTLGPDDQRAGIDQPDDAGPGAGSAPPRPCGGTRHCRRRRRASRAPAPGCRRHRRRPHLPGHHGARARPCSGWCSSAPG